MEYKQPVEKVVETLSSDLQVGLSRAEVLKRQKTYGLNVISVKGEPLWQKIIEPFRSVFMAVMFIAVIISFTTGELLDSIIIFAIILVSAVIHYFQKASTERVLRALKRKELQTVEAIRGGKKTKIMAEGIVPGDIILLHEGEKVPADVRIAESDNLMVDEALLTGESLPVEKNNQTITSDKEVYERTNLLFQGSFVVAGTATCVVIGTGNNTEFGRLAKLAGSSDVSSPVQKKIDKLITQIIIVIAAIAVVVFLLEMYRGIELSDALRYVITISVSAVPEGLPVAITVVLALGMRRMAKYNALVRNMPAIENVGVVTTIATDKTGTLTKNELSVQDTWQLNSPADLDAMAESMLRAVNENDGKLYDPLDVAIKEYATTYASDIDAAKFIKAIPFDHGFSMSGNVWREDGDFTVYVKGAPEKVLALCHLSEKQRDEAESKVVELAAQGLRVIGLARIEGLEHAVDSFKGIERHHTVFIGLIAIGDMLRPEAKQSVKEAIEAGVVVRMITGDHFETAFAIGKQLGLVEKREQVFDSRKMSALSAKELKKTIIESRVFARVTPEYKHKILEVLKDNDITAMTGDGVNDAPALSNAHVGLAMGSGSQIAKEASDIILLDDNFSSIVHALREGRTVFSNIRKMLFYLIATNSGEVLTMVGALIFGVPLPLMPVQILWVNLVTDTSLVIPLGLEPPEKDAMRRPPRDPKRPIIGKVLITRMALIAFTMAIATLFIFMRYYESHGVDYARTVAFTTLVVIQWASALSARSTHHSVFSRLRTLNWRFMVGLTIAVGLQVAALFGPLGQILHVTPISITDMIVPSSLAAVAIIIVSEIHKYFSRRKTIS